MSSKDTSILTGILTPHAEPLGPIDQLRISDDAAENLIDDQVSPFKEVNSKPYMLMLGRKGAGKSAILAEIRLNLNGSRRQLARDHLPEKGKPYIIPVTSWEHFHQLTRNVARDLAIRGQIDELLADLIPPEYYFSLWYEMLWDEIIQHFYNYINFSEVREALSPVEDYINADKLFQGPVENEAKKLFNRARESILAFLQRRKSQLYFLFDSMENYPVRNIIFSRVLNGLFQALNKVNSESGNIKISFCIPEELERFLTHNSSTLLKDFASSYRIRWRPIDLLRITAHRFRLAIEIHDKEFYKEIADLDFSQRQDIHQFFSLIFPPFINNSLGFAEDPLAYIIRHTQLLPRHVILTFNAILSRNFRSANSFRHVCEAAIREGVSHVQELIANQVLYPYERLYPKLITICRQILPDLRPVCSFSDLKKIENRFGRRIEDDIASLWDTLFQIGVIGRVARPISHSSSSAEESDRYCYGQFHFNIDGAFGMATDSEYCFHPVFSRAFGVFRRDDDKRVVYPANIDMITLT